MPRSNTDWRFAEEAPGPPKSEVDRRLCAHELWLFSPVKRPGEARYNGTVGVDGALTTER
jgi:hypothetical protein